MLHNKCFMLHIVTHATSHYLLGGSSLPICNTISDFGIKIYNLLSFKTHIHNMVSIANRRIYLIRRCFLSNDVICLIKAFVVFVHPLLEYCSAVGCLSYKHLSLYRICSTSLYKIPPWFFIHVILNWI